MAKSLDHVGLVEHVAHATHVAEILELSPKEMPTYVPHVFHVVKALLRSAPGHSRFCAGLVVQ
jgi:hypothetical protein